MFKKLGFILLLVTGFGYSQYGTQQTLTLHAPSTAGRPSADGTFTMDNLNYPVPTMTLNVPLITTIASPGVVDWVNVVTGKPFNDIKSYGAIGDNSDSTSAIQRAVSDSIGGKLVFTSRGAGLATTYRVSSAININGGIEITCASPNIVIASTTATQNIFVVNTNNAIYIHDCTISAGVAATAGAAILVNGAGGPGGNRGSRFVNLIFNSPFNGIQFENASTYIVENCKFISYVNDGLFIRDTISPDTNDSGIINNIFDGNIPGTSKNGIYWESGGGLRIVSNKFINGETGINVRVADGVATSDILIANNSIENHTVFGIRVGRLNLTGTLLSTHIVGNQIVVISGTAIQLEVGLTGSIVSNNIIAAVGGTGVSINSARTLVSSNQIGGAGTAVSVGANATGVKINQNQLVSITVANYTNAAAAGEMLVNDTFTGILFLALPTAANGTILYCSDCTIASPCAGGGTGAISKYLNGAKVCN
jgi:hypothetical protein